MIDRLQRFFRFIFESEADRYDLDDFLESKNITSISELEYWMAEYDHRKRIHSRLISQGKLGEASWVMKL
jgi:hypothetical protein